MTTIETSPESPQSTLRSRYQHALQHEGGSRILYLAYAYARGIPYRVGEPTARPLRESLGLYHATRLHQASLQLLSSVFGVTATEAEFEAWMGVPESPERRAKRAAAESRGQAERDERRALYVRIRQSQQPILA